MPKLDREMSILFRSYENDADTFKFSGIPINSTVPHELTKSKKQSLSNSFLVIAFSSFYFYNHDVRQESKYPRTTKRWPLVLGIGQIDIWDLGHRFYVSAYQIYAWNNTGNSWGWYPKCRN